MKWLGHLRTISEHKKLVMQGCFRLGLYSQGLLHDLSKYMPSEFLVGAKYYQGFRSPNNAEREAIGYSSAWLHHKGRNKHHYEYWIDVSAHEVDGLVIIEMPVKYVVEMYADRVAASKVYNKGHYTDDMPLKYFEYGKDNMLMGEKSKALMEKLLVMLANKGEAETEAYIRKKILHKKYVPRFMISCGKGIADELYYGGK